MRDVVYFLPETITKGIFLTKRLFLLGRVGLFAHLSTLKMKTCHLLGQQRIVILHVVTLKLLRLMNL